MQVALPVILCSLTCLLLVVTHFIPHEFSKVVLAEVKDNWYKLIKVAGFGFAIFSVLRTHIRRLQAQGTDWQYSVVALVCFLVFPMTYLIDNTLENRALFVTTTYSSSLDTGTLSNKDKVKIENTDGKTYSGQIVKLDSKKRQISVKLSLTGSQIKSSGLKSGTQSFRLLKNDVVVLEKEPMKVENKNLFFQGAGRSISIKGDGKSTEWVYNTMDSPLDTTMFALVAFYICSAAYRSFRVRNFEAGVLLFTGLVVILVNAPLTNLVWNGIFTAKKTASQQFFVQDALINLKDWLLAVPGGSAGRGILIGGALGLITQSLRVMFGIERSWLG